MALQTRLDLRQGQQLVMTPQLQQAIKLLQLSNMELTQFVETELERNPLLEREDNAEEPAAREADDSESHDSDSAYYYVVPESREHDRLMARFGTGLTSTAAESCA